MFYIPSICNGSKCLNSSKPLYCQIYQLSHRKSLVLIFAAKEGVNFIFNNLLACLLACRCYNLKTLYEFYIPMIPMILFKDFSVLALNSIIGEK